MITNPTVLTRMLRYPVEVLGSETPLLVTWIIIREPDGSIARVEYKADLVCIDGDQAFWRYVRFVNRLRKSERGQA